MLISLLLGSGADKTECCDGSRKQVSLKMEVWKRNKHRRKGDKRQRSGKEGREEVLQVGTVMDQEKGQGDMVRCVKDCLWAEASEWGC